MQFMSNLEDVKLDKWILFWCLKDLYSKNKSPWGPMIQEVSSMCLIALCRLLRKTRNNINLGNPHKEHSPDAGNKQFITIEHKLETFLIGRFYWNKSKHIICILKTAYDGTSNYFVFCILYFVVVQLNLCRMVIAHNFWDNFTITVKTASKGRC